jgi:peptidyl-prolyl cis-trans isomerase B (cyclophilin B)
MKPTKALKITALMFSILLMVFVSAACGAGTGGSSASETGGNGASGESNADNPKVEITVKDFGVIDLELDPSAAPETVANFLALTNEGFYDGLTFHRTVEGFMIQGGDPLGTGFGGSDQTIQGEFSSNGVDNPISHKPGVISMARGSDPNSASSQFFIVTGKATFLDGNYAAFGTVTSGLDVATAISKVPVGPDGETPVESIVIESIRELH